MSHDQEATDFTPPTIEEISQLLPAYEVLSFIAKGGMGAVYMANQRSLDRPVAIKVLPRHFGEDEAFRDSFEAEAKSMAKLNHPNLIGIYDFGQVDGLLYIIMEMVQGKSLYHSSYGRTLAPDEAARIISEVCSGLANAHQQGILHRDIKPSNILLDPSASPKIGDFGLARPVGEHERDLAYGTPGYTAPEVVHHPEAVDQSTDIFSVGVMLYELLTGKLPDDTYTPAASITGCSPEFDQIISKAINPNPALRYRSAKEMGAALRKLTDQQASTNPLITGDRKGRATLATGVIGVSTGAKKTLIPSSGSQQDQASANGDANQQPTPPPMVKMGSNVPFIRNIIIIIALLATIVIAWEGLKKVQAERKIENERVAKQNEEKKKIAELKRQQAREKAAARVATQTPPPRQAPKAVIPPVHIETPREALDRLQSKLLSGARTALPKGTITRGARARMWIDEQMSWHQASQFCENHGGHIAVIPEKSDLLWLTSQLDSDQVAWLGAGSAGQGQWSWVDGSPWALEIRDTAKASCVSVDDTGILTPEPASAKHSFFIEWMVDGSTPATFEKQLKRCAESLDSETPVYPAGSITYDNRYYLLAQKKLKWSEAQRLAQLGGASLAVPSNADENEWMGSFINAATKKSHACWIGGLRKAKGRWQWVTGEPWNFAKWTAEAPDENTSDQAGCAVIANQQWKDFPARQTQDYFLIEWSKDGKDHEVVHTESEGKSPLAERQKKCNELVRAIKTRYDKEFANNVKAYELDLRVYQRSLTKSQKTSLAEGIAMMQASHSQGRLSKSVARDNMPAKLLKILDGALDKQSRLEDKYLAETETLREKYRALLFSSATQLKEKGLTSQLRDVEAELSSTSSRGLDFVYYITGETPPVPEETKEDSDTSTHDK